MQPECCFSQVSDGEKEEIENRSSFLTFFILFFCLVSPEMFKFNTLGVKRCLCVICVFVDAAGNGVNNQRAKRKKKTRPVKISSEMCSNVLFLWNFIVMKVDLNVI